MRIEEFLRGNFDHLIERGGKVQNTRCKINTGFICDQACSFCYFYSKRKVCNTSLQCIMKQLNIAKNLGVESVDFSGGEPTIHESFLPALQYAKNLQFKNICCITNGTRLAKENFLRRCITRGLDDVLISIHGTVNVHYRISKTKNSFAKALNTINNCQKYGIKPRINTVVTKENYKDLPNLARVLKEERPYQWNLIIYKMQYECGDPEKDNFISHAESSLKIKDAIDIVVDTIPYINVRYIPFCYMRGYERHVTNYPQKKYDSCEWSNYLLRMFEMPEDEFMAMNVRTECIDLEAENEMNVTEIRKYQYTKPEGCVKCKNFLICDGFENKYAEREYVSENLSPTLGRIIRNSLHYRRGYYDI